MTQAELPFTTADEKSMQLEFNPGRPLWPYQIYMDRNSKSVSGSVGRRYVCSTMTLGEAVAERQRITRASILALYAPHMSAADLNYAFLVSGAHPFIVGALCVPFSAGAFARDCCCEITGEVIEHPISGHPCDKNPPPHLISDPTAKPVIGSWRKDRRCINYLPVCRDLPTDLLLLAGLCHLCFLLSSPKVKRLPSLVHPGSDTFFL